MHSDARAHHAPSSSVPTVLVLAAVATFRGLLYPPYPARTNACRRERPLPPVENGPLREAAIRKNGRTSQN
jgi:hypothetical protein